MARRDISDHVKDLKPGDRICLVYQDLAEQMEVVVPFLQDGLASGECCLYVVDDRIGSQVLRALGRAGVDVESQIERGALVLLNKYRAYIQAEEFDPRGVIERLRKTYREKIEAGFTGLRIAAEMTWALGVEAGWKQLLELEGLFNRFFTGKRARNLCQYNANRFPVSVIQDVCRIHPKVITNGDVSSRLRSDVRETDRMTP